MNNWQACVLNQSSTVQDVIQNLNATSARAVLIVDSDQKFVGIVVDGDIRRGMLRGVVLTDQISEIINRNPITVSLSIKRVEALKMMEDLKVLHLPIVDVSGQLCGLHLFNEQPTESTLENLFLIMAGGFGRRMGSLTSRTPKPMLEFAGKPILEHLIISARNVGFKNFAIAIHYLGEVIEDYFGDGSRLGINIKYLRETEPLGTAGAIRLLEPIPKIPFLVSNADLISNIDFAALLDFHKTQSCDATMAVRTHQWQNPFGVVEIVDGRITNIIEKPILHSTISAGIYVLNPSVVELLNHSESCDMPTLFQRLFEWKGRLFAFPIHEEWNDIGFKTELESAQVHSQI